MRGDLEEAVEPQILTPAKGLRLQTEEEEAFEHGLVFVKFPEILVKGHSAFSTSRLDKMKARAQFSNYTLQPFNFRKVMRIMASIFAFSEKWYLFVKESETKFRMFSVKFRDDGATRKSELTREKV